MKPMEFNNDDALSLTLVDRAFSVEVGLRLLGGPRIIKSLDYHEVEKLYCWLEGWMDEQRDKCSNCNHERAGCQVHYG